MPKSIIIEPDRVFARETIAFSPIPVNAYDKTFEQELADYSAEDLMHIWRDMCAIREFESALQEIKTKGSYNGVTYTHAGPAHLSIGQEGAAVGRFSADLPVKVATKMLFGAMDQMATSWVLGKRGYHLVGTADTVVDIFLRGAAAPGHAS